MPAIQSTVKLSDRLSVGLKELNAEEAFVADELIGSRVSRMIAMKMYAICSVRKVIYYKDRKPVEEWTPIIDKTSYDRFMKNPIGDGEPLSLSEVNALVDGFIRLDGEVGDPKTSSDEPFPMPEGSSPEPSP